MKREGVRLSGHLVAALVTVFTGGTVIYLVCTEVPVGKIRGQVVSGATGAPLTKAKVYLRPDGWWSRDFREPLALRTDKEGRFGPRQLPAGRYTLAAQSRAHKLPETRITIGDGQARVFRLELPREPSRLEVVVHQHACATNEPAYVLCSGLLEDAELLVSVYATDLSKLLLAAGPNLGAWVSEAERRFPEGVAASERFRLIRRQRVTVLGRDVEGVFQQRVPVRLGGPGLYLLTVSGDGLLRKNWVLATDLALITKQHGDRLVAYATGLVTGEPVPGARLTVYRPTEAVAQGVTGPDGLVELRLPPGRDGSDELVLAEHDGSLAAVRSWYSPAEARDFQLYMCTDRPVYRPGDLVQFKGILRRAQTDRWLVPANEPVTLEIRDELDSVLYRRQLRTSDYGTFDGKLQLNPEALPGYYAVTANVRGRAHEDGFQVAAYRKPECNLSVRSTKARYVRGDEAEVAVRAEYYFGGPLARAPVTYWVERQPYWFSPEPEEDEGYELTEEEGYEAGGDIVHEGSARTDAAGVAHLRIPTRLGKHEDTDSDWRFVVRAWVTGPSRQTVEAEGEFLVTRGEFVVGVEPSQFTAPANEAVEVRLTARDYDGKPVPSRAVEVMLQQERWEQDRSRTTVIARRSARIDTAGAASVTVVPPEDGSYIIKATARDDRGNEITAREYLWVTSEPYASFEYRYPELEIITNKRVYQVGDTIRALVNTKEAGATALVSLEGQGLRRWWLQKLEGRSTLLRIPVREEYIPNVYLTVGYVRGKQYARRAKQLPVSPRPRTLTITLRPSKTEYQPGEPVACEVTTADPRGRPVPAELGLGVVDESVYAVREDTPGDIMDAFYARRPNEVETCWSFPELYLGSGDKAAGPRRVRKRFPDTAFWAPRLRTNQQGRATVTFPMPDTLTTWRFTARGCTLDTLVGSAVGKVVCRQPFMARLQMPRFLVQGDESVLTGTLHNETGQSVQAKAALQAAGLDVLRTPQLALTLSPGQPQRLEWRVRARGVGPQLVQFAGHSDSGLDDALGQKLPVLPRAREEVEWRAGVVDGGSLERFSIRQDAVGGMSRAELLLSPSLTSSMWAALDYLAQYPWGCVEQTTSSFLPDVLIARALREVGLRRPELEARLPDMVQTGLEKLYGFRRYDGGWGWWRYDTSDPWMTAYVLFALVQAQHAGFAVNPHVLQRGLGCLDGLLRSSDVGPLERAFAADVLVMSGSPARAGQLLQGLEREQLDAAALALVALAYHQLGDTAAAERAYVRLWAVSRGSEPFYHWVGGRNVSDGWLTDTEATALALKASLAIRPADPRLSKVVRWLMTQSQGDHWVSTRDTAFILYAVADYVRLARELRPDLTAQVLLNGKPLAEQVRFGPEDAFAPQRVLPLPSQALLQGDNVVEFTKQGTGSLCYSLRVTQYVRDAGETETITGPGLGVERNYYKLSLRRDPQTGELALRPARRPQARFRAGDLVRVKLSVRTAADLAYMMLDDPLPAGAEVLSRDDLEAGEWDYWYSDMIVRDELVGFFARDLPSGRHLITYDLRLELPGRYHALPTHVSCMYQPSVRAVGPGAVLEVAP